MYWKYGNGQQIVILAHVRVSPFFYTMFVYHQHNKLRDQLLHSSVFKILNTRWSWRVAASYYKVLRLCNDMVKELSLICIQSTL